MKNKLNNSTEKVRQSNLELLRIILIIAIIAHHYVVNSGLGQCIARTPDSFDSIFLLLYGAWGKTAINCFLMITGYFMCKQDISLKKFLKLLFIIEFYKILFGLIFMICGYTPLSLRSLKNMLPFTEITQGFISCYLVFFLCIPFLNILIRNMTQKTHALLVGFLLLIYTILPSMSIGIIFNYVTWFCVVYILAAYIRCYPLPIFEKTGLWGAISIALLILSCASIIILACIFKKQPDGCWYFVADSNKIFAVALGISLFLFFKNVKIAYSAILNAMAKSVFGVLLIHANSDAMRKWLWYDVLKNASFYGDKFLILHAVLCVSGIFICGTLLDQLRIFFIEKPFFSRFGNFIDSVEEKIMLKIK